jgi:hypothetical protein
MKDKDISLSTTVIAEVKQQCTCKKPYTIQSFIIHFTMQVLDIYFLYMYI